MATLIKKISELTAAAALDGTELIPMVQGSGTVKSTVDNLIELLTPPGMMSPYAGSSAPTGWLLCDGTAVSRTTYANLFVVISTTWGVGDGSTTFNLPDMREAAPTGIGTRSSGVTAHDVFTLAQFKDDQGQGHYHGELNGGSYLRNGGSGLTIANIGGGSANATSTTTGAPVTDGTNGTPRTGTVTRGKRLGVNFIIKT